MLIKDLKQLAAGTQVVGFPLCIRTARQAYRDADGSVWQDVLFVDKSGEMLGQILLLQSDIVHDFTKAANYTPWKSKQNIVVMDGTIQDTDERKKETTKLVITECFNAAPPLDYDQTQSWMSDDADEWRQAQKDVIRGKIRHWEVASYIRAGVIKPIMTESEKKTIKSSILYWQDFIETGE